MQGSCRNSTSIMPAQILLLLLALATSSAAEPSSSLASLRTFGGGIYTGFDGRIFSANETVVFAHNVTRPSPNTAATMTMLWMLAGKEMTGRFVSDNVIFRYYLDGEQNASLEFKPGAAAGSFVHLEGIGYYRTSYDPKSAGPGPPCNISHPPDHGVTTSMWPYCGLDLADSDANDGSFQPWMTKWAGKNGAEGSWLNHFRIPFFTSVRVTAQLDWSAVKTIPPYPGQFPPTLENSTATIMCTLRGLEGDETALASTVRLGGVALPPLRSWNVRLTQHRLSGYVAKPLEFVPLATIGGDPAVTGGAMFQTTVNWRPAKGSTAASRSLRGLSSAASVSSSSGLKGGSIEGCWWATEGQHDPAPNSSSILLGTGVEDFFNSAFGFSFFAKIFHNDNSGLSHVHNTVGRGCPECEGRGRPSWFSAYRYFDADPLTFSGSNFRFVWRNGAYFTTSKQQQLAGKVNQKCTLQPDGLSDHPSYQTIDSYTWLYTWSKPSPPLTEN